MEQTLYQRLGGSDGIMRISRDILAMHLKNPIVAPRFAGIDQDKAVRLAHQFMCVGCGGPETYTGREMREVHKGMNISEQEFVAVLDDILAALEKNAVAPGDRDQILAMLYGLKGQIVRI